MFNGRNLLKKNNTVMERYFIVLLSVAAYTMDSHNCRRIVINKNGKAMVKNEGNVEIGVGLPYPISYRSIVPSRVECTNLIVPVCLSASHIAYGSIRMEPVFMVLGQVSGLAACLASEAKSDVQDSEGDQVIPQGKWDKGTEKRQYLSGNILQGVESHTPATENPQSASQETGKSSEA